MRNLVQHDAGADSRRPFCLRARWAPRCSLVSSAPSPRRLRLSLPFDGTLPMKSRSFIVYGSVSLLIALLFLVSCTRAAAQTNTAGALKSNAPTGLYVSAMFLPSALTVRLETNGLYQVREESGRPTGSQHEEGTWKWNAEKQEFQLTPKTNSGGFRYEFRRLRADKQESNTLQWIPLHGAGGSGGAIDYIRFKRKLE